jgi:hypothetical protein
MNLRRSGPEALIGLILGDYYASRPKAHYNTRLIFDQPLQQADKLRHSSPSGDDNSPPRRDAVGQATGARYT